MSYAGARNKSQNLQQAQVAASSLNPCTILQLNILI